MKCTRSLAPILSKIALLVAVAFFLPSAIPMATAAPAARIPVILDTDIGDDIDDTWALGLLLNSPELDLRLVVGDYGRAEYRARLLAKFLTIAQRTNVAVGLGLDIEPRGPGRQAAWVKDFSLESYSGPVHRDGVQALIDTVMNSKETVTIIAIGPLPNLAIALEREPRIAQRARFVGMHGSVRIGYGGSSKPAAEWNVRAAPFQCQKVFTAAWPMTITPLDTCGIVDLKGDRYQRLRNSSSPVAKAIVDNYVIWSRHEDPSSTVAERQSSTLFDTVAVYLAIRQDLCRMETLSLRVTDDGFTVLDEKAKPIRVATAWTDLDAFRDFLVERLTAGR